MNAPLHATFTHTGIIVADLAVAMSGYTAVLGYHWAPPVHTTFPLMTARGLLPREIWVTYTKEGPHHLELIEQVDRTAYEAMRGGPRPHHLGFATHELRHEVARLEGLGFPSQLSGQADDGGVDLFSYHFDPNDGLFIELYDAALQAGIDAWAAGDTAWRPPAGMD